jgi:hypothetical protein
VSIVQTVIAVNHEVRIRSPKTARGRRNVALDQGTVAVLRRHRQQMLAGRLTMAPASPITAWCFVAPMASRCTQSGSPGRS